MPGCKLFFFFFSSVNLIVTPSMITWSYCSCCPSNSPSSRVSPRSLLYQVQWYSIIPAGTVILYTRYSDTLYQVQWYSIIPGTVILYYTRYSDTLYQVQWFSIIPGTVILYYTRYSDTLLYQVQWYSSDICQDRCSGTYHWILPGSKL